MPSLFVDTERLRSINTGLGQVSLHLGRELARLRSTRTEPWDLAFMVPRGARYVFGDTVGYVEASWLRKLWIPGRFDVAHSLHQDSAYVPAGAKLILTIYDLNFLERDDYAPAKKARKLAALQRRVDRASMLTAASAYTAAVVRRQLRVPETVPLRVVGTGVTVRAGDAPPDAPPFMAGSKAPYLLYLGAIHPRKNVQALVPLLEAFPDRRLVLAGPDHHPVVGDVRDLAARLRVSDRLLMPGSVDDATRLWLYANCEAFLFPSLSEGFGLPPLEAMTFGKPVFLSRLTSLPEVAGEDAFYFAGFEPDSMARSVRDGLKRFEADPEWPKRLQRRAAQFRWDGIAEEYWRMYEELAAS